ncbi:hypothetical protein FOA43_000846 [Brettanomyces nanus]|uniref:Uncharacterized protein n=1 Tax=Eeniella nana TaxID=13502 RepID=A0A875RZR4_EENNA|nr:uncharacterized protein FOA43_000846 [Brettanomyces nanus]QPG73535.1 hypothetical protein FOA43_000846 [Brettanomyces nanus]
MPGLGSGFADYLMNISQSSKFLDFEEEFFKEKPFYETSLSSSETEESIEPLNDDYFVDYERPSLPRSSISSGYSISGNSDNLEMTSTNWQQQRERESSVNSLSHFHIPQKLKSSPALSRLTKKLLTKQKNEKDSIPSPIELSPTQQYFDFPRRKLCSGMSNDMMELSRTWTNPGISRQSSIVSGRSATGGSGGPGVLTPGTIFGGATAGYEDISEEYFSKQSRKRHHSKSFTNPVCSLNSSLSSATTSIRAEGWTLKNGLLLENDQSDTDNQTDEGDDVHEDDNEIFMRHEEAVADLIAQDVLNRMQLD